MPLESSYAFRLVSPADEALAEIMKGLMEEYASLYGDYFSRHAVPEQTEWYLPPQGGFIVLEKAGQIIAMGGFKRYDAQTAEFKRIWVRSDHRQQGLAGEILSELERLAAKAGYSQIYLTTGFRQRGATRLYLRHGFHALHDLSGDLERYSLPPYDGRLGFRKAIDPLEVNS